MDDLSGRLLVRSAMGTVFALLSVVASVATAHASDAVPVADGAYMKSTDACDRFRKGQLDSIEFSVSKDGHAYDVPEAGCVVASVRKLRTSRYVVEADCLETGNPFQRSFILDVESHQTIRIDGTELISCDAQVKADNPAEGADRLPGIPIVPSTEQHRSNAEATKAVPPTKLIRQWQMANENCRGGSGDDPQTMKDCESRDALSRQLEAAKWCYGKQGQSGYQYKWHRCGKGSLRY